LLRSARFSFCLFRLICDLMFAMSGAVYQRALGRPPTGFGRPGGSRADRDEVDPGPMASTARS
jgi:hypothetical protein